MELTEHTFYVSSSASETNSHKSVNHYFHTSTTSVYTRWLSDTGKSHVAKWTKYCGKVPFSYTRCPAHDDLNMLLTVRRHYVQGFKKNRPKSSFPSDVRTYFSLRFSACFVKPSFHESFENHSMSLSS